MTTLYQRSKAWLTRNRTPLLITTSVLGGTYLLAQYALTKLTETRQRLTDDRLARENLRRRFAQNQEDCTYTVLALLPTAAENIVGALEVERVTGELQARRAVRGAESVRSSEFAPTVAESRASNGSEERREGEAEAEAEGSVEGSASGSGFVHASQVQMAESAASGTQARQPGKSKIQLWDEVKIYSITRALTLIYTLSLLTLLTRIQLNLLGRRNYMSSSTLR